MSRSNEDFIKDHSEKYTYPALPPVWKTLEVVSFGTLSKLFCLFKDNRLKKQVAREFGLPQYTYLESWIRCITVLRNCCANHHQRLVQCDAAYARHALGDMASAAPHYPQAHHANWQGSREHQAPRNKELRGGYVGIGEGIPGICGESGSVVFCCNKKVLWC